jgi:hypothetical protein
MSNPVDFDEVDSHLKDIEKMYTNETLVQRLKMLFNGLKAPRQSREYKVAMIELQRLSAPVTAILLPALAVGILIVMSSGANVNDRVIETQVLEADEVKDLEKIEEFEKPEDQIEDTNIDVPIDSPNVKVEADTPDQPMSPQPQAFDAVMTVKSPVILKNVFGSVRNLGTRGAQLSRFGGDQNTEGAVLRALRWLKLKQRKDGSWGGQAIAMTGLGILTFLAHGEKPGDPECKEFGATVQKALEFLMSKQGGDGRFSGMDGNQYAQPIATYALCEAYGMTLNPNVKEVAIKALAPILKGQHPTGGWTYKMDPGMTDGKYRDDTSYMGWCAQALKAAKLANVYSHSSDEYKQLDKASKLAVKGFQKNAHPDGGFGYTGPGKGGLTSVGSLCMQLLGASNQTEVKKALEVMDSWTPAYQNYADARALAAGIKPEALIKRGKDGKPLINKDTGLEITPQDIALDVAKKKIEPELNPAQKVFLSGSAQYYYYYAAQCKFHQGGKHWENWNRAMKPAYLAAQQRQENAIEDANGKKQAVGWWENMDAHSDRPVMDTCLAALQLMVYYRYLPTTSADAVKVEDEIVATSTDTDDIRVDTGNL